MICDSYYQAIRSASPSQIEAIDMGRRALHNEGSELLIERLKDKIGIDFYTARRLFTPITVLHWKRGAGGGAPIIARPQAGVFACALHTAPPTMRAAPFPP